MLTDQQEVVEPDNLEDLQLRMDENEGFSHIEESADNDRTKYASKQLLVDSIDEDGEDGRDDRINLIINYLPQDMMDSTLFSIFEPFGEIHSAKVVREKGSKKCLGYGFVKYHKEEAALKAIEELNGYEIGHKRLKVSFARPASEKIKNCKLYVTNLPKDYNTEAVNDLFKSYGEIIECRVLRDPETTVNKGVAFVQFSIREEAEKALVLNGERLPGSDRSLVIKYAEGQYKKRDKRFKPGSPNGSPRGRSRSSTGDDIGVGIDMNSLVLSDSGSFLSSASDGNSPSYGGRNIKHGWGYRQQQHLHLQRQQGHHHHHHHHHHHNQQQQHQQQEHQQHPHQSRLGASPRRLTESGGSRSPNSGNGDYSATSARNGVPMQWYDGMYGMYQAHGQDAMYNDMRGMHQQKVQHGTVFMAHPPSMGHRKPHEAQVTITVMCLPESADVALLHDIFAPYGRIISAQIDAGDRNPSMSKGVVVIEGVINAHHALHGLHGAVLFEGCRPLMVHITAMN